MPDGEIRKDEITRRFRPIQVGHSNNGRSSQDRKRGRLLPAAMGEMPCILQRGKEKEIARIANRNVGVLVLALEDLESDDGWRIHRSSISRRLVNQSKFDNN